jgi:SAM-dependent methyltransferase
MGVAEDFWNQTYTDHPFKAGKAPSPFLHQMLPRLAKGKALDIAMGEGANAVYLAQKGFEVKGFDLSSVAVEHALALARETGVTIEAKRADLDLYLLGLMEYDTVVMTFFKPNVVRYYTEIIRTLKQGGTLLVESYGTEEMTELLGREDAYKHYYFHLNELLRNLTPLQILFYQEGLVDGRHVVQCLARKPLDKDAAKYNLFDMHSQQKQQTESVHQKLADQLFKKS